FLVLLIYELLGEPVPSAERLEPFLRSRAMPDGGYVEIPVVKRSGVNPTAAAIASLQMLGGFTDADRTATQQFYQSQYLADEGGFRANDRIPIADVLSTFTACWTLDTCGLLSTLPLLRLRKYVQSCAEPGGGYRAASWDTHPDVEYTFYGLGALALLAEETPPQ
ncbi:MAG: prenyltransferase/squalene oxidase repeat-containing protein, partial [Gemmataceae bacterium]